MSSIGPQLPPHLTKRKHDDDDDDDTDDTSTCPSNKHPRRDDNTAQPPQNQDEIDINGSSSDSEDDYGPPRPSTLPAAPAPRSVGPSLPPHLAAAANNNEDEINLSDSDSDPLPQPPPATAAATATNPPNPDPDSDSSDDDDDDFGPSLPSASAPRARQIGPSLPPSDLDAAPKRDEWMLAPPPSSSTFSERDTTKIRARKFASKPSAAPASAPGAPSIWTETPEEKLKRLQDSVLGRTPSASSSAEAGGGGGGGASELQRKKQLRDEALAADIQAQRGKTLLEEHQGAGEKRKKKAGAAARPEDEEDDPSKRAFDREKDMAVGGRITATQRKELINKSANFGGRFQKGSFL
ncbi:hypothetical protein FP744_10006952 [Trichoderma asperellum]|nr:hypothetical protein LI328DRAFT_27140 [Trichoderma asperelloides]